MLFIMIIAESSKQKNSVQNADINKYSLAYINKFESAVKNFEIFVEEEKMRKNLLAKSRFASFN